MATRNKSKIVSKTFPLRIPSYIADAIDKEAQETLRSRNATINMILRDRYGKEGRSPK